MFSLYNFILDFKNDGSIPQNIPPKHNVAGDCYMMIPHEDQHTISLFGQISDGEGLPETVICMRHAKLYRHEPR